MLKIYRKHKCVLSCANDYNSPPSIREKKHKKGMLWFLWVVNSIVPDIHLIGEDLGQRVH